LHFVAFCSTIAPTPSHAVRHVAIGEQSKISQTGGSLMFRTILHANDGSVYAVNALKLALGIAKKDLAELHMVSVQERGHMPELPEQSGRSAEVVTLRFDKVVQQARALAEESHVKLHIHVLAGHPVRDIIKLSGDLDADLIILGASGHSALYDRMIGSRAQRVLHHATCPVLIVK
jgi:nucleotide-binding universal stress UspA family protein